MIKPGYKTSEMYVTIAGMIVAALVGLGIVKPADSAAFQPIALSIVLIIVPLGYATCRTWLKTYAPIVPDATNLGPIVSAAGTVSAASLLPTDLANSMQWHDSNVMPAVGPFLGRSQPPEITVAPIVIPAPNFK